MHVKQEVYQADTHWRTVYQKGNLQSPDIVLCFGSRSLVTQQSLFEEIQAKYPSSEIVISSTSGEIIDNEVKDESIVLTAMEFAHTELSTYRINITDFAGSHSAGKAIVKKLCRKDLAHVFILADGQLVNGSELVKGLNTFQCPNVTVTGGLAADGFDFSKTFVGLNNTPSEGNIVALAFYGDRLQVGFGSHGGWDAFGPERLVTKSEDNVLYELDGMSALSLYKTYLGEAAAELPSSALFFPLAVKFNDQSEVIVRTILSIDEEKQSMTFAGDIPTGAIARLMRHNPDHLIDGAEKAGKQSLTNYSVEQHPDVAILISCVGRKFVLGQNVEEEVEVIRDLVGKHTAITGFYSYGEIAPQLDAKHCQLHNQTMTITTMTEI